MRYERQGSIGVAGRNRRIVCYHGTMYEVGPVRKFRNEDGRLFRAVEIFQGIFAGQGYKRVRYFLGSESTDT